MEVTYLRPRETGLSLGDLGTGDRLLLWSARSWVAGHREGRAAMADIQRGLALHSADTAGAALDALMSTVARFASRRLDYRCTRCASVSPDEQALLAAAAAAQLERPAHARSILAVFLAPAALPMALTWAREIGACLREAELPLRAGRSAAAAPVPSAGGPAVRDGNVVALPARGWAGSPRSP